MARQVTWYKGMLNPLGEGGTPGEATWPVQLFVACKYGVYATASFGGPSAPQPTWTDVTAGLTLGAGVRYIKVFAVDPFNKGGRQFCLSVVSLTSDTGGIVHRRVGSNAWTEVLTEAQARVLGGGTGRLRWIAVDTLNDGYIYALYVADAVSVKLLASSNYGDSWVVSDTVYTGIQYTGVRNLRVLGTTKYIGGCASGVGGIFYRLNDGAWARNTSIGVAMSWLGPIAPTDYTKLWILNYDVSPAGGGLDLARVDSGLSFTVLRDGDNLGVETMPDAMWVHDQDYNKQKLVVGGVLRTTTDGWGTIATAATLNWQVDNVLSVTGGLWADSEMMIFGQETLQGGEFHHVYVMEGNTSTTLTGRAGEYPATPPYVDSIPYTAGGCCYGGSIQVVV